jgi:hypothetical protein
MPTTPTPLPTFTTVADVPPDVINKLTSPNWAEICTAVGTLLLVLTAVLAGIFTLLGIRQTRRIQHAQTFLEISRRWNEEKFRQGRVRIRGYYDASKKPEGDKPQDVTTELDKLKVKNEEEYWESLMTPDFFEIMAMNIRHNSITFEMVYDLMGSIICLYWKMLSHHIHVRRTELNNTKIFVEFENLAYQMGKAANITEKSKHKRRREMRRVQKQRVDSST